MNLFLFKFFVWQYMDSTLKVKIQSVSISDERREGRLPTVSSVDADVQDKLTLFVACLLLGVPRSKALCLTSLVNGAKDVGRKTLRERRA